MRGLFLTGTDTGVGKTRVGTALAAALIEADYPVRVRKPVESGCEPGSSGLRPADGTMLAAAADASDSIDVVTPYRLQAALSPERAARLEGMSFSIDDLAEACLRETSAEDFLLVEGAGGFYSPLTPDGGLNVDLAQKLGLPVLLIVADRLGCINHTLLTLSAIESRGLAVAGVVLNEIEPSDDLGMNNFQDLQERLNLELVQFPFLGGESRRRLQSGWWRKLLGD